MGVDAQGQFIALPRDKIASAHSLIASTEFDPGVARIPSKLLQKLRGKLERWGARARPLLPELSAVDKLLRNRRGESDPAGGGNAMMQARSDFWETMEFVRISMLTPNFWSAAFTSSFFRILPAHEKLSFAEYRKNSVWAGLSARCSQFRRWRVYCFSLLGH